jgi:hypothetical protein
MSAQTNTTAIPPIEVVSSEVITSLAFAAHAYMEPIGEDAQADLDAADIAIDLAGKIFDRMQTRLQPSERSAFARLLTELRMTYVRKRGA